jgi:hypothetical protein
MIKRGNAVAAVWVLAAVGWMGACGGGDDGGSDSATLGLSGGASPADIQQAFCERFAKELCAARTKCCAELPPDGPFTCEESVNGACYLRMDSELHDGWVFSAERIDATLQRLQTAAANCGAYRLPDRGDPFAPQVLALGDNCTAGSRSEPCAEGQRCVASKCAELLDEGDTCSNSSANPCGSGLYCNRGVCESVAALGEPCQGSAGCEGSLRCVPTDTDLLTNGSVCDTLHVAGETCSGPADCAGRSCGSSTCGPCTTDASCGEDGRCIAGECSTVFNYSGEDASYIEQ